MRSVQCATDFMRGCAGSQHSWLQSCVRRPFCANDLRPMPACADLLRRSRLDCRSCMASSCMRMSNGTNRQISMPHWVFQVKDHSAQAVGYLWPSPKDRGSASLVAHTSRPPSHVLRVSPVAFLRTFVGLAACRVTSCSRWLPCRAASGTMPMPHLQPQRRQRHQQNQQHSSSTTDTNRSSSSIHHHYQRRWK